MRTLSGIDIQRINATIEAAKAKFSSAEYSYLDDPSPGDYFNSIVMAAKLFNSAVDESKPPYTGMGQVVSAYKNFFKDASSITDDQAAPFGKRECRLLPKQFRNCHIEPRIAVYMGLFEEESLGCKAFVIDSVLKTATALMADRCDQGLSENGSTVQDMQRRMMQYAEANNFEGGSENNCLPLFVARFTRSSQAVRIFKTALGKYLLAVTTVHAFCTVIAIPPTQSEDEAHAKTLETHRIFAESLARVKLNNTVPWACDDVDAEVASLDDTRLVEIIDKARQKVSSGDHFFNDSSAADFFDIIKTAAGNLATVQKATRTDQVIEKLSVIKSAFASFLRDLSSTTDEQSAPFGLNECGLLPPELNDIPVVPIISSSLDALQAELEDYDGMADACETSNIDDILRTLRALVGKDCEEGTGHNKTLKATMQHSMMRYAENHQYEGGSENKCLHLFVARYTRSEEAMQVFKKSFDKYLLASVTVQAVCAVFTPKCKEQAYRTNVLDTHASFAASLTRTSSVQLNKTAPWKCDDSQQVIISKMNASCERVKFTAASDTYFLGEMTPEEFENMTYGMVDALKRVYNDAVRSYRDAATNEVFPVYKALTALKDRLNESRIYLDGDDYRKLSCYALRSYPDYALKEINEFVAPGCQNRSVEADYDATQKWRKDMFGYAVTHGFDGCEDNKCLQVFIARYTNHSHEAVEKLQHSMNKFVYISVFAKSFCDSLELKEMRNRRRNETIRQNKTDDDWAEKVNSDAKQVIDAAIDERKPTSWEERQGLHEAVAKAVIGRLDDTRYSYKALAYLPYADDERHAFMKLPNNVDVVRHEYASVNYVITRRWNDSLSSKITSQWDHVENKTKEIFDAIFSTRAVNLTSRIEKVAKDFGPFLTQDGFRALAALRCGYEFVWYELGYRYFPAGYATGNHTLFTQGGSKYTDKCGQIIFLP